MDIAYRVSRLQSSVSKAKVFHLAEANKVVSYLKDSLEVGLRFPSKAFVWESACLLTVTDASWANDTAIVNDLPQPHRSQRARAVYLSGPGYESNNGGIVHIISFGSSLIKRVCRSTFQAETQALLSGVEDAARIRACIAELRGGEIDKDWEETSTRLVKQVMLSDCNSLVSHLTSPVLGKLEDKRLSLDLHSLRQDIWVHDKRDLDHLDISCFNNWIRWIDTSAMVIDSLTKAMSAEDIQRTMQTGHLSLDATPLSRQKKAIKRAQRRSKKDGTSVPSDEVDVPEE
jgi:hypothetical protein